MASEENINFLDLACVFKIVQDTTLERFGSTINSSVFDAANITGSLKQKGLIDFTAYYPGPNSIVLTDAGKKLKEDAEAKSMAPSDSLDEEILKQMSGGKRFPIELQNTLNVRPTDLAFRLYKLFKQNMLSYELKNGNVEIMLTEQGFLRAKAPPAMMQAPQPQAQPGMMPTGKGMPTPQAQGMMPPGKGMPAPQAQPGAPQAPGQQAGQGQTQPEIKMPKKGHRTLIIALMVVIVIVVVALIAVELLYPQVLTAI